MRVLVVRARSSTQRVELARVVPTPHPFRRVVALYDNQQTEQGRTFVANIKSQMKRIKTNAVRTERNKAYKSELRTWIRKTREAVAAGDAEKAADALKTANKKLDKAVSKGVIHKNQAANKKSALTRQVNGLGK